MQLCDASTNTDLLRHLLDEIVSAGSPTSPRFANTFRRDSEEVSTPVCLFFDGRLFKSLMKAGTSSKHKMKLADALRGTMTNRVRSVPAAKRAQEEEHSVA